MTIVDDIKNATAPFGDGKLDWRDARGIASCLMIAATLILAALPYACPASTSETPAPASDTDR